MKTVAKNTLLGSLIYTSDYFWIGIDSTCPYLGKPSEWVKKRRDKGVWQTLSVYCFGLDLHTSRVLWYLLRIMWWWTARLNSTNGLHDSTRSISHCFMHMYTQTHVDMWDFRSHSAYMVLTFHPRSHESPHWCISAFLLHSRDGLNHCPAAITPSSLIPCLLNIAGPLSQWNSHPLRQGLRLIGLIYICLNSCHVLVKWHFGPL